MSDRELLLKVASVLTDVIWQLNEPGAHQNTIKDCNALLHTVAEVLTAPEPDAMEIVDKIRETHTTSRGFENFDLPDSEAAALIADHRRVPRAMLKDIENRAWRNGNDVVYADIDLDAIAAKHGVKVEPPVGKEGEE